MFRVLVCVGESVRVEHRPLSEYDLHIHTNTVKHCRQVAAHNHVISQDDKVS